MLPSKRHKGVTLIELMTVVVIVSILASVAIPSYRSYLIRSQRSDGKTALLTVRAAQEKFYLQNNSYSNLLTDPAPLGLGLPPTSANGFYRIEVVLTPMSDGQRYTAFATPIPGRGQTEDTKCLTLSLNDLGLPDASGPGGAEYCWR